ncbi:efflux pump, RND family, membrane fusion lipoprotein [Geotalea daltonii FRC-32]|uniref:Efflux pump, RND family, membrane fusion lipoprotein n=1 Tax=Geotalea daltonii (strain DSM 22248 / JCM 15807 / FRC-32) TaxID=316067 RepID=B9LZN2_GEODF|nr:efflux RND transporter periplasmic adaptor subunit [Geotalea daltonii]ACM18846.1 efflux pump, RND family, membrane fusion lipoprotein [Geotalea daltonii FRC-32]
MRLWKTGRLAVYVVLVLLVNSACSKSKEGTKEGPGPIVSGIIVEKMVTEMVPEQVEAVGSIRSINSAQIAARIAGTVTSMKVREGDSVGKGALLMTLASAETTAGAAGARAAVEQASHGVEEARSRKQFADVTFERYQKLLQEEAVTRQEYDGRLSEKEVAARSLAKAEAALAAAREGARGASSLAGYGKIYAPISGIIVTRLVDVGMTVFPGTQLFTLEEQGAYRLEVAAPESLLGKVKVGGRVPVSLDGVPAAKTGVVEEVVPAVDRATRTFIVKIALTDKGLRSGSYGSANFQMGTRQGLLLVKKAVVTQGALTSVWVVGQDGIVRMRIVKTGKTVGDKVEILAGLAIGEAVVTAGMEKVVEGARVEEKSRQQ